eukprot:760727-Hanusia_phi.AAC.4
MQADPAVAPVVESSRQGCLVECRLRHDHRAASPQRPGAVNDASEPEVHGLDIPREKRSLQPKDIPARDLRVLMRGRRREADLPCLSKTSSAFCLPCPA